MSTKKKAKSKVSQVQSTRAASAKRSLPVASVEDQIASLEWQIAALQAGGKTHASPLRTPDPRLSRAQLQTPQLGLVLATSNAIVVTWNPVANASDMFIEYSKSPDFAEYGQSTIGGSLNATTLEGLQPNTTYYIRVKAGGVGSYSNSEYSAVKSVTTLRDATAGDNTAGTLQNWLTEMQTMNQDFSTLMPELGNTVLTTVERRRLRGSGVRRYGFIDKVSDSSTAYPQFWPDYLGGDGEEQLKTLLREIEVLRNLLVFFNSGARTMQDLLLLKGDEAFRLAGTYYATVREAARRGVPDAETLFRLLNLFWQRRRSPSAEPTIPEVRRDMHALLRGTKDGEIIVRNESDHVVKGEKFILDNTRKRRETGVARRLETEEVEVE